jgi:hypothetical protein
VELSSDTTPTLGGDLDAGTYNINNVGVITATTFSGNVTGNADTATTATYAETAGISTYATTAGVSTNAQGLTGTPNITVGTITGTDATFSGDLTVQGTTTTIDTAVTEVDSLQVDGNVGIGTTNATEILHVQTGTGDEITTFKVKTSGRVELSRSHASAPYIKTLMNSGNPNIILGDSVGDRVLINGHGASYFNAGNVGINSTIPTSQLDVGGTISDSKGDLRKIPFKQESSAYTLVLADSGKAIEVQGDVTVPNNVFTSGDTITIINDSSSNKTISKGTGLQYMFNTADGTNANRTLGGRGMATIYFVNSTTCYISGSQLT